MNKLYRIKDSKIDKKGLYAKKDIAQGTRIIQYIGKLITKKQTDNNDKFDNDKDYKQCPCKCKSKKCCGYIVREGSRWRINKKFKITKRANK